MEKFIAAAMVVVIALALLFGLALLMAYPTMWSVNYLFSAQLLFFVFGTAKIGFWQAFVLNMFFGIAFNQNSSSSKSK
jgi:hypothetical protein